jgi:hypothetical protein
MIAMHNHLARWKKTNPGVYRSGNQRLGDLASPIRSSKIALDIRVPISYTYVRLCQKTISIRCARAVSEAWVERDIQENGL